MCALFYSPLPLKIKKKNYNVIYPAGFLPTKCSFHPYKGRQSLMSEEERVAKMETKLEGQESHSPVAGGRKHTSAVDTVCGQGLAANSAASVSTATVKAMTVKDPQGIPSRYGGRSPSLTPLLDHSQWREVLVCGLEGSPVCGQAPAG